MNPKGFGRIKKRREKLESRKDWLSEINRIIRWDIFRSILEAFGSITEAEELVYQRCLRLLNQTELIRGLTSYHWWSDIDRKEVA